MSELLKDSEDFISFIHPKTQRLLFIRNWLSERNIESSVISLENKNHIFIRFPQNQYNPTFKIKTVIAHYDRVAESEGANDNSFAVFTLMNWALKLSKSKTTHNIRLILTDGEEAANGLNSQGAFHLAGFLQKIGIAQDEVYVFDCMGRGNIPVLCDTKLPFEASPVFKKSVKKLEEKTMRLLKSASSDCLTLPASYSDNAGFIARGIPAVTITMLPSDEIEAYMKLLMKTKIKKVEDLNQPRFRKDYETLYPKTWRLINSENDKKETLTAESQGIFEKILENLATLKTVS